MFINKKSKFQLFTLNPSFFNQVWCHTAISPKFPGTGGSHGSIPSGCQPLAHWQLGHSCLSAPPYAALMVMEIRWHPVCMVPVLLEVPSRFTLQCCMPGKTKETVTDNKIPNGDLSGICPASPWVGVPGELRVLTYLLSSL